MQCVECESNIVNPICNDCLSEGVACWVGERLGPTAASAVFDITAALKHPFGDISCIKCSEPMAVCGYCYTDELLSILQRHPAVMAQFLYYFNLEDRMPRPQQI